ncbi:RrF2 family transcriptional regulator [Paenibacillus sp. GCM10012307]|uniref:Rrf2 family transcriptional regulator n=1 Tax=Paenibacillus roseus TaxID=2798579 RepID=A0A934J107_9BACL|nr:Rrf2 family transcriptional regulator [Paenibacillus roseus]MBJ6361319.1 Rrf2 family transcriptional regulator [Paenibacillus roseus]
MRGVEKCSAALNHKWFGLSLQALVVLSKNCCTCPSSTIAEKLHSEPTVLRRILATLARENILETREGRDGGYRLKKPADQITLAEIYRSLRVGEPLSNGMIDTTGIHSFGQEMKAAFADIAEEIDNQVLNVLERHTLADLADRINL